MSTTLNKDSNGYPEGQVKASTFLKKNILGNTIFIPGVTFTPHVLNNAGEIEIGMITQLTEGGATALDANGNPSTHDFKWLSGRIDKKVDAKVNGLNSLAGTQDEVIASGINMNKIYSMGGDFERASLSTVRSNTTTSTLNIADYNGDYHAYLIDLGVEYTRLNGKVATVALVSIEFMANLAKSRISLATATGDAALIKGAGSVVEAAGLTIIPTRNLTGDKVIIYSPEGLNIIFPANPQHLGTSTVAGINSGKIEFFGGLTKYDETPTGGSLQTTTWIAMPFGILIADKEWFLESPEVVTP